jgi:hypothetical protein
MGPPSYPPQSSTGPSWKETMGDARAARDISSLSVFSQPKKPVPANRRCTAPSRLAHTLNSVRLGVVALIRRRATDESL